MTIGEILDRAIATYLRRFVPLFVILGIIAIPAGVLSALAGPSFTHVIQILGELFSLPPGDTVDRTALLSQINRSTLPGGSLQFAQLLWLFAYPLAQTAIIVYAAGVFDGTAPTIASAYRVAVRRWLPQIVVAIAFLAIGAVLAFGFVIAVALAVLAVSVLTFLSRVVGVIAVVIVALVAFVAAMVVAALGVIAWLMATISVALDDGNPVRAIGRGLRRTLDRPLFRRTLGVALAVVAISWFGDLAILAFAGLAEYLTHLTLLYGILAASAGVMLNGVTLVFVLLYVRDVQLRREGSDLMEAAAAPSPAL